MFRCIYCLTNAHTTDECHTIIKSSRIGTLYKPEWLQGPTGRWSASSPQIQNLPDTPAAAIEMLECRSTRDAALLDLIKFGQCVMLDGKHVPAFEIYITDKKD